MLSACCQESNIQNYFDRFISFFPSINSVMSILDYTIICFYLLGMVSIGLYFKNKASSGIDSYFLGNHRLPWWVLGASGMASNLDISGTMINIALIYAFGAMGFFIEIRGGIVLIMAFLMIFMGKWNRRARVMTLAEWMEFRFGNGRAGRLARIISALAVLITTVWIIAYFAIGAGKFISEFLGLQNYLNLPADFWAAVIMIGLATLYTVSSGLFGVVWTDVFQGFLIFITIIVVCTISFTQFTLPEKFLLSIPLKDGGFTLLETTRAEWTRIIPRWQLEMPPESAYTLYNYFGIAILFYLIKTVIDGSAGTSGYMIQRFFASRSDRDAGLLSLFWTLLLSFRWPFIAAIAVMGIVLGQTSAAAIQDPERVLPIVINQMLPIGLKGLLVAGLMAAGMSTFDSMVNAGAAYWVKDIYQTFINPGADQRKLLLQSRLSSIVIVLSGLFLTFNIRSINDIWGWLTMGIGAGMLIPLLIRWYWWRLNGYGFATGIAVGMITAIVQRIWLPDIPEYLAFSLVSVVALMGTIGGTLVTAPTEETTLRTFYLKTRPFGWWGPISRALKPDQKNKIRLENRRDLIAIFFAVPWQLTLFLFMMVIILKRWDYAGWLMLLLLFLSAGLYQYWFRNLSSKPRKG